MRKPKSTHVTSLIFEKKHFNYAQARAWAKRNGFKFGKVDSVSTPSSVRIQQFKPNFFTKSSFRSIPLSRGVRGIIGKLKKGYAIERV